MPTVEFLCHFNGSDGATSAVDSSSFGRSLFFSGAAALTTAQQKFGTSSLNLTAASSTHVALGDSPDINLTGSFCFEGWLRLGSSSTRRTILSMTGAEWALTTNPAASNNLILTSSGTTLLTGSGGTVPLNTWKHWAWSYDGTTHRLFLEGALVGSYAAAPGLDPTAIAFGADFSAFGGGARWLGQLDEIRITTGDAVYTAAFTPPTAEFPDSSTPPVLAYTASPGPLGSAAALSSGVPVGRAAAPALLGAARSVTRHDFTAYIDNAATALYTMRLVGEFGTVQVPISNWQATLRAGASNFLQCNVPACQPYVDALTEASSFTISRESRLLDGRPIVYEMASADVSSLSLAQGTSNYTATLTGFSGGFLVDASPSETFDRQLTDVRQVTTSANGMRIRCGIEWLLRPGMRATFGGSTFSVGRISYFVDTASAYMDVSEA